MAGTPKRIAGPAFLSNAAANIYTPSASTIYTLIRQIHLVNVTTAPVQITLYIGATGGSAAGTEIAKLVTIAADSYVDLFWPNGLFMASTDFLTGLAGSASAVTITVSGDQSVV
jgi:hypothetical protein